jgi:DNA-binding MarR family transcriptional regulator
MEENAPAAKVTTDSVEIAAELRLVVGRIARRLRQSQAVGDVTLSEVSVLARLDRDGPDSPGTLAESEGVRPQAMATTLAGLEERGLVSRRQDAADGRRAVVTVTAEGRRMLADRRSESVRLLATALDGGFTPEERQKLAALLPLLDRLSAQV